jgi:hypothetical protein
MKRMMFGALAVALMAGCSSVSDIRKEPPLLTLSSAKTAQSVAECIRDGWQAISLVGGSVGGILQSSQGSYAVIAPGPESPWHVADVTPSHSGSVIVYRFYRSWQSPPDRVMEVVRECAK